MRISDWSSDVCSSDLQTQGKVLKRALKMLAMVYRPPLHRPDDLISRIVGWSEISRRQGLLGLEPQIEAELDPFVSKGLQLLVDGGEPEAIRSVLEEIGRASCRVRVCQYV